jgi:hypothetical protein
MVFSLLDIIAYELRSFVHVVIVLDVYQAMLFHCADNA